MRFFLVEFVMFFGAFLVTYLMRRLLGRRISGPPVILWCFLFAFIGAQLTGFLLPEIIGLSVDNPFGLVGIVLVRYWENIVLGAIIGMIAAIFPLAKSKKPLEDTTPKP